MRLNLYECEYSYKYKHDNKSVNRNRFKPLFSWRPTQPQWWITGFTGNGYHTTADKLVVVGTIDFSGKKEYYKALKNSVINDSKLISFMLVDDDKKDNEKKVWIVWWDKDLNI